MQLKILEIMGANRILVEIKADEVEKFVKIVAPNGFQYVEIKEEA